MPLEWLAVTSEADGDDFGTADDVQLRLTDAHDVPALLEVIHAAFGARRPVSPPPDALSETIESLQEKLNHGAAIIASVGDSDAGALLLKEGNNKVLEVSRVSVAPDFQRSGVAMELVRAAAEWGADRGLRTLEVMVRADLPEMQDWWAHHGFSPVRNVAGGYIFSTELPVGLAIPTADAMHRLGEMLATYVRAGDLLVANGELGAGKTTLTQGLGAGLKVSGPVISPTFVLARNHVSMTDGPDLVHVDAYRMGSAAELEDIDLDSEMAESVTLIEWGAGLAEGLSPDRLDIDIVRSADPLDDNRMVYLRGYGARWADENFDGLRAAFPAQAGDEENE